MLAASILSPQFIAGVIIVIVILCIIGSCIRIVPQAHAVIVERLGGYLTTWSVGVHIKMPFVDHVARNVILKEQVVDFDPQPVITKDNVTMLIDTVVFYQITDPKLYAYGVENPLMAIENLTATTLRNIIGEMEIDSSTSIFFSLATAFSKSSTASTVLFPVVDECGVIRLCSSFKRQIKESKSPFLASIKSSILRFFRSWRSFRIVS